jgi:hypothetical protein
MIANVAVSEKKAAGNSTKDESRLVGGVSALAKAMAKPAVNS